MARTTLGPIRSRGPAAMLVLPRDTMISSPEYLLQSVCADCRNLLYYCKTITVLRQLSFLRRGSVRVWKLLVLYVSGPLNGRGIYKTMGPHNKTKAGHMD